MATEPTIAVLNGASKAQENRDVAQGLTATADIFAKRFEKEMKAGRLTRTPSAKVRGRALVDLLQGLQLRAKLGIELLGGDASGRVPNRQYIHGQLVTIGPWRVGALRWAAHPFIQHCRTKSTWCTAFMTSYRWGLRWQ
jgi:hypothetical protein